MRIEDIVKEYSEDNDAIHKYCDSIYHDMFAENFKDIREMYRRMKSTLQPITDGELEYILTTFPMELFTVAENLNKVRLSREVTKLKNKAKMRELRAEFQTTVNTMDDLTKAEKQTYLMQMINENMAEYEILLAAYDSLISRVENEQTFSKELIMGAKKIWDSRRSSESANPVAPVATELPEYDRKAYIK